MKNGIKNQINKKNIANYLAICLALLHSYTIISGFVAYALVLFKKIYVLNYQIIIYGILLVLLVYQSTYISIYEVMNDFRYFWGWIVFFNIFKDNLIEKKFIRGLLIFLSLVTIIEVIAINFILSPENLPNFPKGEQHIEQYTMAAQGEYQRPYSFAGIPTVGSVMLVIMMAISNLNGWKFWLTTLAIFLIGSGTGICSFLFIFFIKYKYLFLKFCIYIILIMFLLYNLNYLDYVINLINQKIGIDYISYLFNFKLMQIQKLIQNANFIEFIFGGINGDDLKDWIGHGADFGYLSLFAIYGFTGCMVFFYFVLRNINRANRLSLIILLLSSFHYGVISTIPGQMLFGLILAINKNGLPGTSKFI